MYIRYIGSQLNGTLVSINIHLGLFLQAIIYWYSPILYIQYISITFVFRIFYWFFHNLNGIIYYHDGIKICRTTNTCTFLHVYYGVPSFKNIHEIPCSTYSYNWTINYLFNIYYLKMLYSNYNLRHFFSNFRDSIAI